MINVVTFHYTLRDLQGRLIDSSTGGEPVTFVEGAGQLIEGLAEGMRGLEAGQRAKIEVPAAKAYGERDEGQVQRVLRSLLPVEGELVAGDRFQAGEERDAPIVTVVGVEGDDVLLDANHPLAGVDLAFEVEVVEVRPATGEEEKAAAGGGGGGEGCGEGCGCH